MEPQVVWYQGVELSREDGFAAFQDVERPWDKGPPKRVNVVVVLVVGLAVTLVLFVVGLVVGLLELPPFMCWRICWMGESHHFTGKGPVNPSSGYAATARVYLKRCPPNNNERGQWRTTTGFQHQQCLISSAENIPKISSESNFRDSNPEDLSTDLLERKPVWWFYLRGVGVCNRRVWKANQVPFDAFCPKWPPVESRNQWFWAMVCSTRIYLLCCFN